VALPRCLFCGPSGWSYPHWDRIVYPRLRPRNFHPLQLLANYFDAVEINTTFYQPLKPELAKMWIYKVEHNPKFLFTMKLGREFTHERSLAPTAIADFKEGLWPFRRARKLGCVLMQFPWAFRYTEENRSHLIALRRAFHEFPLVAEMRHASWSSDEALGTLIDYRIGFVNIDQPAYTNAMPPTAQLTSRIGYVRLHGRNTRHWEREFGRSSNSTAAHDYLYSSPELRQWQRHIEDLERHAATTFVFTNNDAAGKSVVNALELAALLGDDRRIAPAELIEKYPEELAEFHPERPVQEALFVSRMAQGRAVA
jgi:uncharacterized protein YecE (DUF72 family)